MTELTSQETSFLNQLYTMTGGDLDSQVSMSDAGSSLGLDEDESAEIAQSLCIRGDAELKTLSGGIGITVQGLKELNIAPGDGGGMALITLGTEPVLDSETRALAAGIIEEVKTAVSRSGHSYPEIEEMVFDIKTMETQLLSPRPKTAVIRELFKSLAVYITRSGPSDLSDKLEHLAAS